MGFEKKSFYRALDGTLLISLTVTLIKLQNKQQNFIHITRNKSFWWTNLFKFDVWFTLREEFSLYGMFRRGTGRESFNCRAVWPPRRPHLLLPIMPAAPGSTSFLNCRDLTLLFAINLWVEKRFAETVDCLFQITFCIFTGWIRLSFFSLKSFLSFLPYPSVKRCILYLI